MKISLSKILFTLLCALLLITALCTGAVRGWSAERNEILSSLTGEGEMRQQLEYRGMDAANLCVVASRHLPEDDADLVALRQASQTLLSGSTDVHVLLAADEQITVIALRFAESLPQLPSVQASGRDKTYIATLTSSLGRKSSLNHSYTLMVEDYNDRLSSSPTGWLARLLGVDPLPLPGNE